MYMRILADSCKHLISLLITKALFFYFLQLSGPVTKKSASSDKPKQARARPKKRFGLLQMVQKVRPLKEEHPKITNPWDLTEIPYNVRNKTQIR